MFCVEESAKIQDRVRRTIRLIGYVVRHRNAKGHTTFIDGR